MRPRARLIKMGKAVFPRMAKSIILFIRIKKC